MKYVFLIIDFKRLTQNGLHPSGEGRYWFSCWNYYPI